MPRLRSIFVKRPVLMWYIAVCATITMLIQVGFLAWKVSR